MARTHTITIHQLIENMQVTFDYQPAEPESRWHPGCDEWIDIRDVSVNGVDVTDLINALDGWKRIEECVWDAIEADRVDAEEYSWGMSA